MQASLAPGPSCSATLHASIPYKACTSQLPLRYQRTLVAARPHRDCADRCHICAGTALAAATSAPGLNGARRCHICAGTRPHLALRQLRRRRRRLVRLGHAAPIGAALSARVRATVAAVLLSARCVGAPPQVRWAVQQAPQQRHCTKPLHALRLQQPSRRGLSRWTHAAVCLRTHPNSMLDCGLSRIMRVRRLLAKDRSRGTSEHHADGSRPRVHACSMSAACCRRAASRRWHTVPSCGKHVEMTRAACHSAGRYVLQVVCKQNEAWRMPHRPGYRMHRVCCMPHVTLAKCI